MTDWKFDKLSFVIGAVAGLLIGGLIAQHLL